MQKLTRAKITEKQTIYIINSIILTRFAYRTQNTYVGQHKYQNITNKYTNLVKHKAGLARSIPNSTIHHYQLYSLKKAQDIQTLQHISNFTKLINHPEFNSSP